MTESIIPPFSGPKSAGQNLHADESAGGSRMGWTLPWKKVLMRRILRNKLPLNV